jgi:hypothetical protein
MQKYVMLICATHGHRVWIPGGRGKGGKLKPDQKNGVRKTENEKERQVAKWLVSISNHESKGEEINEQEIKAEPVRHCGQKEADQNQEGQCHTTSDNCPP